MAIKYFVFQALTGGAAGALDAISHTVLTDKDMAIGDDGTASYVYWYDDDSVLAEDSPNVIAPDSGTGRWILLPGYISNTAYAASWNGVTTIAPSKNAVYDKIETIIPATTVMLFGQSAAPTGWTKKVDWQDQSMIVYTTGNIAQGGAVDAKAAHQHAAFTLDTTRIPAHEHSVNTGGSEGAGTPVTPLQYTVSGSNSNAINNTGGGGSHQHTANSAPYYISVIACVKD